MSEQISEKSRISKIHLGRVYNLGNYENIRYEISVDIGVNDNPAEVLIRLEKILKGLYLKSGVSGYELRQFEELMAKPEDQHSEYEKKSLPSLKEKYERHEKAKRIRLAAREPLATLNASSEFTDHKLDWDDEDWDDGRDY